MTPDACSALLPFVPEKEEITSAASYEGEMNGLDLVNSNASWNIFIFPFLFNYRHLNIL